MIELTPGSFPGPRAFARYMLRDGRLPLSGVLAIEVTLPVDRAAVELVSRRADGARVLLLRLPVSSVHPNICECDACWKDREAIGWKRCHAP